MYSDTLKAALTGDETQIEDEDIFGSDAHQQVATWVQQLDDIVNEIQKDWKKYLLGAGLLAVTLFALWRFAENRLRKYAANLSSMVNTYVMKKAIDHENAISDVLEVTKSLFLSGVFRRKRETLEAVLKTSTDDASFRRQIAALTIAGVISADDERNLAGLGYESVKDIIENFEVYRKFLTKVEAHKWKTTIATIVSVGARVALLILIASVVFVLVYPLVRSLFAKKSSSALTEWGLPKNLYFVSCIQEKAFGRISQKVKNIVVKVFNAVFRKRERSQLSKQPAWKLLLIGCGLGLIAIFVVHKFRQGLTWKDSAFELWSIVRAHIGKVPTIVITSLLGVAVILSLRGR